MHINSCPENKIIGNDTRFSITENPEKQFSLKKPYVFVQSSQPCLLCPAERYVQKMQYTQYNNEAQKQHITFKLH